VREHLRVVTAIGRLIARERAWWMMPIVIALAIVGALVFAVAAMPAAPFLYPLF